MTNRRQLAGRLENGASGAFHPQMVADLREAARLLREPVAGEDFTKTEIADMLNDDRDRLMQAKGTK